GSHPDRPAQPPVLSRLPCAPPRDYRAAAFPSAFPTWPNGTHSNARRARVESSFQKIPPAPWAALRRGRGPKKREQESLRQSAANSFGLSTRVEPCALSSNLTNQAGNKGGNRGKAEPPR